MQCKCGGQGKPGKAKHGNTTLVFETCTGCKRVGGERLYVGDKLIADGTEARIIYQEATK